MKKELLLKVGLISTSVIMVSTSLAPLTAIAAENVIHLTTTQQITRNSSSDIKKQFNLTDSYLNSIDKGQTFTPTSEQLMRIEGIYNTYHGVRFIGIDDVLELVAIAGVGYAAGHWAASEAHKRFGLSASSYKSNRWWWRVGIAAAAGIPAALGFDDYFYGI